MLIMGIVLLGIRMLLPSDDSRLNRWQYRLMVLFGFGGALLFGIFKLVAPPPQESQGLLLQLGALVGVPEAPGVLAQNVAPAAEGLPYEKHRVRFHSHVQVLDLGAVCGIHPVPLESVFLGMHVRPGNQAVLLSHAAIILNAFTDDHPSHDCQHHEGAGGELLSLFRHVLPPFHDCASVNAEWRVQPLPHHEQVPEASPNARRDGARLMRSTMKATSPENS